MRPTGSMSEQYSLQFSRRILCFQTKNLRMKQNNTITIWALTIENLSYRCANNNGADQPAHLRRLISAFVVRFLESIINLLQAKFHFSS